MLLLTDYFALQSISTNSNACLTQSQACLFNPTRLNRTYFASQSIFCQDLLTDGLGWNLPRVRFMSANRT
jgi:hypothetical protein